MSASGSENDDSGPGTREIAHRLFACEFDASSLEYADSDEERAPKYVITPTGARVNRLFAVGVLTEVQRVNDEVVRARVVDPTGAFVVYAGQYQPDALAFLERADPPMFVAVTGKANTFQPEDSDRVYTSVRPESIAEVDAETRDRWTVQAADHTLRRIGKFARALKEGEDGESGTGISLAREEYGTTPAYLAALRETALGAARLVAGEVEEVSPPGITPDEDDGGSVDLGALQREDGDSAPSTEEIDTETSADPGDPSELSSSESAATESMEEPETGTAMGESDAADSGGETVETRAEPDEERVETSEAASVEPATDDESTSDDLGDFENDDHISNDSESIDSEPFDAESTDVSQSEMADEDARYEFDEGERAEIEAEFDMDFSSGNEVEEPGEADIEVPEPEETAEADASETEEPTAANEPAETESADVGETATGSESAAAETTDGEESEIADEDSGIADEDSEEVDEGDETVNVEDRAMEAMRELAD
ncbi:MAG: hypothetical protein IH933_09520, partial [Euryarchaeota archaeon]|nr:hypothetical protein [Euryarchaeota archaeon]